MRKVSIVICFLFVMVSFTVLSEKGQYRINTLPGKGKMCTTLIVGKNATKDGQVLFAHNEDLDYNAAQHLISVKKQQHESEDVFELYSGGSIPEVSETLSYIASTIFNINYVPGTITSGINEHQVAIASNLCFSHSSLVPPEGEYSLLYGGVIWTEFTKLVLERAASAREGVELVGFLSESCGLSGLSGVAFGIADPDEAWFVEIPRGGQWVAQRVSDDGYSIIANTFRIGEVDCEDTDNYLCSENLINFAIEKGLYDPDSGVFNFTMAYASLKEANEGWNTHRHERVESLLAGFVPEVSVADIMTICRDHYEGTGYDETNGYQTGSPHNMPNEYPLCEKTTEVSIIAELRNWLPAEIGGVAWWAFGAPCTSVYVPWYVATIKFPRPFTIGTNIDDGGRSAYWAFNRIESWVDKDYINRISGVRQIWEQFEEDEFTSQETIEDYALQLLNNGDIHDMKLYLTIYSKARGMSAYRYAINSPYDSFCQE